MPINIRRNSHRRKHSRRPPLFRVTQLLLTAVLFSAFPRTHGSAQHDASVGVTAVKLVPGTSTAGEIAGGGTQVFDIPLIRHQYLDLSIDKGDLNLSLSLYSPAGQKLSEYTSRRYEAPEMSLVAESDGGYRLEVRSLELVETGRRFDLNVSASRIATARDAQDAAARSYVAEASLLCDDWKSDALRGAIEKYVAAGQVWRSAGDSENFAAALMEAAALHFTLGEYRQALALYQTAAAEGGRAGDGQRESEALAQAGRLNSYLGDNDAAQDSVKRGLAYYSRLGGAEQPPPVRRARAEALSAMGEVYYSKGNLAKTSECFEAALRLFAEVGDRRGEGWARLFLGYLSNAIGERERAMDQFNQALALYRAVGDRRGEALSLTAIGVTHSRTADEETAISLHREAGLIFHALGDRQSEAITLNGAGQAYENLHQYELALESYQQALSLARESENLDLEPVTVYQIASVYRSKGDIRQALEYYERCVRLSHAAKKSRTEAYALTDVAAIYSSEGESGKTLAQYEKILRFYDAVGDRRGRAITLNNIGDFFSSSADDKRKALDFYRQALQASQSAGERGVEIAALYKVARAERDCGDSEQALAHIKESIKIIEALRSNVASPDFRSSYFAGVHSHYELYIDLLMRLDREQPGKGFAAAALLASENARARSLVETLAEARADIRRGADPAVLQRERELLQLLRAQGQYQLEIAAGGGSQAEAAEVEHEVEQLRSEYEAVEGQVRQQSPRFASLVRPEPPTLEEIQAELRDGNDLLLEYSLGDERSYLWAVTANSLNSYELPPRATLEAAAREVYNLLTARQLAGGKVDAAYQSRVAASDRLYQEKALALSRMTLGPVADRLEGKRLVIVTEGVLQYIPFDALPSPSSGEEGERSDAAAGSAVGDTPPLVSRHEVVSLPSISTLVAIRREGGRERSKGKLIAVLADPVFSNDDDGVRGASTPQTNPTAPDPDAEFGQRALRSFRGLSGGSGITRLAHSSDEADAIVATAPRGTSLAVKGFDASRETAMSPQIGEYQIVHFSTHGFLNSEHPEFSGMVLTMVNRQGGRENGFLQLHDIYNMNLSADLVVLSACGTGLGKDVKGEGLVGLTRGFMHAGSKSVVASLWEVDDEATAELMRSFYKAMLHEGLAPAAALRSAKESVRQHPRWSAPYFWAGFVLQGEYREPIKVGSRAWLPAALLLAATLLTAGSLIFKGWRGKHRLR